MRILFLLLLSALTLTLRTTPVYAQTNCTADPIPLTCNDRGYCIEQPADFSSQPLDANGNPLPPHISDADENGRSCVCETGFTGVNCETTTQFCDGNVHSCLNGGSCVSGTIQSTSATVHVCNCKMAIDEITHSRYIGLHCELKAPIKKDPADATTPNQDSSSTLCDDEGTFYCVHEGTCKNPLEPGKQICDCTDDYVGYHCEYKRSGANGYINQAHESCDLDCKNDGTCYVGTRNATDAENSFDGNFDPNVLDRFQHCQCLEGSAGVFCEKIYQDCGDNHCYHDSVCQPATATEPEPYCSCTNNATHNFVGTSCQVHSTSFCTKSPGLNGHQFCTNKGQCLDIGSGLFNCTCPGGFHGQHCEFPTTLPLPVAHLNCYLKCENGGKCMEGAKTHGFLGGISDVDHLINSTSSSTREYCDCPTGFAGDKCEHKADLCPNGQHVCFHGGKCVPDGEDYQCDCAASSINTAGIYCQHKSTTICDAKTKKFCVNGGQCKEDLSCECSDEYRGPYCEFRVRATITSSGAAKDDETAAKLPEDYQDKSNEGIIISSAVVGGIAILAIIVTVIITGTSAEQLPMAPLSPTINIPPVTMFPPAPPASPSGASATNGSAAEIQDGSARTLNFDDKKDDEAAVHVNELI